MLSGEQYSTSERRYMHVFIIFYISNNNMMIEKNKSIVIKRQSSVRKRFLDSFQTYRNMIVLTMFLLIMNQIEYRFIHTQEENY